MAVTLIKKAAAPRRRRTVPTSELWLSPKEAAQHLGVSVDLIYDACAKRGLKHSKLGHSTIRIRREKLDEWADALAR
jgi:excisionase family DNA binding protein